MSEANYADCEERDGWFLAQDVNAWSSLAYGVAGVVIVVAVVRWRVPRAFLALAVAITVEGVGSLLYHGDPSDVAQLLHDGALVATLGLMSGWHVGRLSGAADVGASFGLAVGVVAGALAASTSAAITSAFVAGSVIIVVAAELLARRAGRPAVWNGAILCLIALALLAWVSGTTGSPLCDAESWLQPHALWHVLSALVVLAWVARASAAASPDASLPAAS